VERTVNTKVNLPQLHLRSLRDQQKVHKDWQQPSGVRTLPHTALQGKPCQLVSHSLHCGTTEVWWLPSAPALEISAYPMEGAGHKF